MSDKSKSLIRRLAGRVASSFLLSRGRSLWESNSDRWDLPLSKWDKLMCGSYIILHDVSAGKFPPTFEDQAEVHRNEADYNVSLPGYSLREVQKAHATKPFWDAYATQKYLRDYARLVQVLQDLGLKAGDRLLELGCGSGWMAEFLALAGYSVLGTTISQYDVELGNQKVESLRCKQLNGVSFDLRFLAAPMESVDELPGCRNSMDAVYVYEALHHAFDWRKTLRASFNALKPNGRLVLASEPNRAHTFISYRVARLSKTHEIGFARPEVVRELKAIGFSSVRVLKPIPDNWVSFHWLVAGKGGSV
jgi:cyclopropane fatty-acyl-phospholipid synthase-like methyltransferase